MNSLVTTQEVASVASQIAGIYTYLQNSVTNNLVNFGANVPPANTQNLPWIRINADTSFDAVYTFYSSGGVTNWYTKMPFPLGMFSLFPTSTPVGIGWIAGQSSTVGISPASGYEFRQFTGTGLLVIGNYAFRRYDQAP